jgi:hypothetical protein
VVGDRVGRRLAGGARVAGELVRFAWRAATRLTEIVRAGWHRRPGARSRDLEKLNRIPLPNLNSLHPEVRNLPRRELGVRSIPLDLIAGTAVAGPAQRGSDFKPLPAFRSTNWQGRMQRLRSAFDQLVTLPPIDVVKYRDRYWVEDGHNRVAAGLELGQIEVDAAVTEIVERGTTPSPAPESLASVLSGTADLRAAGAGRLSRTVSSPRNLEIDLQASQPGTRPDPPAAPGGASPSTGSTPSPSAVGDADDAAEEPATG